MFSPHLQSLVAEAHVQELHGHAHAAKCGRDIKSPWATRLSAVLNRAVHRVFARGRVTAFGH